LNFLAQDTAICYHRRHHFVLQAVPFDQERAMKHAGPLIIVDAEEALLNVSKQSLAAEGYAREAFTGGGVRPRD
jgi:hypothetical protein